MQALDPSQEVAVQLMCSAPFCIITGGPGTGKTTCTRVALDRMDAAGESYLLAAPTGKAAKRMSEATGRESRTIHRLLGFQRKGWFYHAENLLPAAVVLIDEASMLDIELFAALTDAIGPATRLVLIGDAAQLPSVGPGRVLADLVETEVVPVARLTTVHRAAAESWICRNAPKVLVGEKLELTDFPDFRFIEADDAGGVAMEIAKLMKQEAYRDAQVLIPQRTTGCGVEAVNNLLQATLNPAEALKPEWKIGEKKLRRGDRVIQTSNNYDLAVFNGEVGIVKGFAESTVDIDFGDRVVPYTKHDAIRLELAYALTVHKSQGSEFAWVICVVHSAHTFMLQRNLFYTAITRAKKGVIIVGNRKGLKAATDPKDPPKRNTALVERVEDIVRNELYATAEALDISLGNDAELPGQGTEAAVPVAQPSGASVPAPGKPISAAPAAVAHKYLSEEIQW